MKDTRALIVVVVAILAALAFAPSLQTESTAQAQTGRWHIRVIDMTDYAEYWGSVNEEWRWVEGGRAKYDNDIEALLADGWEPYSAGIYNGPFLNTTVHFFRKFE